jgi:peptide/nickel transport system substrate-binding protein
MEVEMTTPRAAAPTHVAILLSLALAVAACTTTESPGASAGASRSNGGAAEGGTLRVATAEDLRSADNIQARNTWERLTVGSTVFDPLFVSDAEGNPSPALATEAVSSEGDLVWTLTLQEGVTFHNGKEFTADDVVANIEAFVDPANASVLAENLENLDSVEALSPTEVQLTLKEADANLPSVFTDILFIGDMDARAEMGADAWAQQPIGTGPYQWGSRTPGESIVFERFDDYWRGRPPFDTVEFRVIPDPQVAALELQDGGVDVVPNYVSVDALPELRDNPDIQVLTVESNTYFHVYLNMKKGYEGAYGDDPRAFREGIAHIMNAQEQVPQIIGEFGTYATQPTPPWQAGHDPDLEPFDFDPELGVELLTQAGYPPGSSMTWLSSDAPYLCDWATAAQSTFEELGYEIDLTCAANEIIEPMEGGVLEYKWDLTFNRSSGRATACSYFDQRFHSRIAIQAEGTQTLQSEEVDQLIQDCLAASDPAEAESLGQEINRVLMTEEIASIGGYWQADTWAARSNVEGLVLSPLGFNPFLMNSMTTVRFAP